MSVRSLLMSLAVMTCGAVCYGQAAPPPQPFGGGGGQQPGAPAPQPFGGGAAGGQQPAAPPPQGLGGAPAAAGAPVAGAVAEDAGKDKEYLDGLVEKKLLVKTQVKGKQAGMWVAQSFTDLSDEEKQAAVRKVYKYLIAKDDPKFKSPMMIFVSDGKRQMKIGMYTVTAKGDSVKFAQPRAAGLPIGAGFVPDAGGFGPVDPADDGTGNGNGFFCQ